MPPKPIFKVPPGSVRKMAATRTMDSIAPKILFPAEDDRNHQVTEDHRVGDQHQEGLRRGEARPAWTLLKMPWTSSFREESGRRCPAGARGSVAPGGPKVPRRSGKGSRILRIYPTPFPTPPDRAHADNRNPNSEHGSNSEPTPREQTRRDSGGSPRLSWVLATTVTTPTPPGQSQVHEELDGETSASGGSGVLEERS